MSGAAALCAFFWSLLCIWLTITQAGGDIWYSFGPVGASVVTVVIPSLIAALAAAVVYECPWW